LIKHTKVINDNILNFKLTEGFSAETSGPLFCLLSPSDAEGFIKEHREVYGQDVWVIGEVQEAETPTAKIAEGVKVIEVEHFLHDE
jgi:selenide,water dikinase